MSNNDDELYVPAVPNIIDTSPHPSTRCASQSIGGLSDTSEGVVESDDSAIRTLVQQHDVPIGQVTSARLTTISAFNDGEPVQDLEVARQAQYQGHGIISSEEASQALSFFGDMCNLLDKLNDLFGTNYSLQACAGLESLLMAQVDAGYDFGTAYAHLALVWYYKDFHTALDDIEARRVLDQERRTKAYDNTTGRILDLRIPPRRVWDLFSNRIIPHWAAEFPFVPISHSWVTGGDLQFEDTSINAHQWRVPIPKDTTLERIRIELLSYDLHYVWLDVLCLRQRDRDENEPLRLEEWRLDVPTIGSIYDATKRTVHYYSGLGRPFRITNLEGERHWLNRAWTLQETSDNSLIAGVVEDSPVQPQIDKEPGRFADPLIRKFYAALTSLQVICEEKRNVFSFLFAMRYRSATSELDKVMGLAYLLGSRTLPTYIEGQPPEEAWKRLVQHISPRFRGDLLFLFHCPGQDPKHLWYPSWQQIKDMLEIPGWHATPISEEVIYDENRGFYLHRGYRLDKCTVNGLALVESGATSVNSDNRREGRDLVDLGVNNVHLINRRKGSITVVDRQGIERKFPVVASHSEPIPDGCYTLVGNSYFDNWVVGQPTSSAWIQKVSVLQIYETTADMIRELEKSLPGRWRLNMYA